MNNITTSNQRIEENGMLVVRLILSIAASILLITGIIKIVSVFGHSELLKFEDPVFNVKYGVLMPIIGILEIIIGMTIILSRNMLYAGGMVLWLGLEFAIYRVFSSQMRPGSYCPCLGSLGEYIGLNQAGATKLALIICITLIVLGLLALGSILYVRRFASALQSDIKSNDNDRQTLK